MQDLKKLAGEIDQKKIFLLTFSLILIQECGFYLNVEDLFYYYFFFFECTACWCAGKKKKKGTVFKYISSTQN